MKKPNLYILEVMWMINSGKVNDPNKFAKKLVEQRIAANMEDAMEKLSAHDDIIDEEDVLEPEDEPVEEEPVEEPEEIPQEPAATEIDSDVTDKLAELEEKVSKMSEFLAAIKDTMNKNFREIDQRLNDLKSKPAQKQQEDVAKKPASKKSHPKCDPDNYSDTEISVEKIFSNAHGRLQKKK
jgi:hypothetical protein